MAPSEPEITTVGESSAPSVVADFLEALSEGKVPDLEDWILRHPEHSKALRDAWSNWHLAARAFQRASSSSRVAAARPHSVDDVIGDYRLVRMLGQGGQGAVWEAEQLSLRRLVALKLIRQDRVGEQSELLLQREARAGGRLSHPGIVTVYAWGESDGVHWIAQELVVGGRTLFDWISLQREASRADGDYYTQCAQQLALICDALAAAHARGIIHRDVKPLNILLDSDSQPKLTDFGLARVSDEVELSVSGDVLGTYSYMSPEQIQASRSKLDARTDIFSLGVVMYEMLSLRRPFEGDTTHQVVQKILYQDAPDMLASRSQIPRDLAVICGKAMEKSSAQRYANMEEFAADLRRWLANEPIHAMLPGASRRVGKWMQRNPAKSVAAVMGGVGLVVVSLLLWDKTAANKELERQVLDTLAMTTYQTRMLANVRAHEMGTLIPVVVEAQLIANGMPAGEAQSRAQVVDEALGRASHADVASELLRRTLFARAAEGLPETFADRPLLEASLRHALGESYRELGLSGPALEQFEISYELRRKALGPRNKSTLISLTSTAGSMKLLSRFDEASSRYSEGIEGLRLLSDEGSGDLAVALFGLAICRLKTGRRDEGLQLTVEALVMAEKHLGEAAVQTLRIRESYGSSLARARRFPEAEEVLARAEELGSGAFEEGHAVRCAIDNSLGGAFMRQGKFAEAAAPLGRALTSMRRRKGARHPDTLTAMDNLAQAFVRVGRSEEGEALMLEALAGQRLRLGNDAHRTLGTMKNLGTYYVGTGRLDEAQPLLEEAYQHAVKAPDSEISALYTRLSYGALLLRQEQKGDAWDVLGPAAEDFEAALGLEHPKTRSCLSYAIGAAAALGEWAEAERLRRLSIESLRLSSKLDQQGALPYLNDLLAILRAQSKCEAADVTARQLVALAETYPGVGSQDAIGAFLSHAALLLECKQAERAEEPLARAKVLLDSNDGQAPANLTERWSKLRSRLDQAATPVSASAAIEAEE